MPTTLAFEKRFEAGHATEDLGQVEVRDFAQIRILALVPQNSSSGLKIDLAADNPARRLLMLDTLLLGPGETVTRVYDVPGTNILVFAEATGDKGFGEVYIWGRT